VVQKNKFDSTEIVRETITSPHQTLMIRGGKLILESICKL